MLWGLNSVAAQPASGAAVSWLRGQIHSGLLLPGEKLPPERKLAEDVGISRVTLREALKALEADRYVTVRRGAQGGAFVTGQDQIQQMAYRHLARDPGAAMRLLELRLLTEPGAARLAAARREVPDLKHIDHALAVLRGARGFPELKQAEALLRLAVGEATHNPFLFRAIREGVYETFAPYPDADFTQLHAADSVAFADLAEAIRDRDEGAAEAAAQRLVLRDRDRLRATMRV